MSGMPALKNKVISLAAQRGAYRLQLHNLYLFINIWQHSSQAHICIKLQYIFTIILYYDRDLYVALKRF